MVWTEEMRAKAAATRLANKEKREARALKREQVQEAESVRFENGDTMTAPVQFDKTFIYGFDWENCELSDAVNRQAEMKREYDRISAIVLRRQNPNGKRWTCFTEELRQAKQAGSVPKSVLALCLRTGEDGRWKFRDDGRVVMYQGMRTLRPAFCCNSNCFSLYQQFKGQQPR